MCYLQIIYDLDEVFGIPQKGRPAGADFAVAKFLPCGLFCVL